MRYFAHLAACCEGLADDEFRHDVVEALARRRLEMQGWLTHIPADSTEELPRPASLRADSAAGGTSGGSQVGHSGRRCCACDGCSAGRPTGGPPSRPRLRCLGPHHLHLLTASVGPAAGAAWICMANWPGARSTLPLPKPPWSRNVADGAGACRLSIHPVAARMPSSAPPAGTSAVRRMPSSFEMAVQLGKGGRSEGCAEETWLRRRTLIADVISALAPHVGLKRLPAGLDMTVEVRPSGEEGAKPILQSSAPPRGAPGDQGRAKWRRQLRRGTAAPIEVATPSRRARGIRRGTDRNGPRPASRRRSKPSRSDRGCGQTAPVRPRMTRRSPLPRAGAALLVPRTPGGEFQLQPGVLLQMRHGDRTREMCFSCG